jgi:hypothetical protein
MEETLMAAFPKCSFIEVWLELPNGQHAVISFSLTGSHSLILTLSLAQATLDRDTVALSKGYDAVILFVNDDCSAEVGTVEAGRETACRLRFDNHQTAGHRFWGIRHVQVAEALKENGVKFVAMRCAGFDKVDVKRLNELDIKVSACLHSCLCGRIAPCQLSLHSILVHAESMASSCCLQVARVPTYSPESVAEHSVTLALALNRCHLIMTICMLKDVRCGTA